MAKYNMGFKYNYPSNEGGFLYNSTNFVILINLFETISMSDTVSNLVVKNILREKVNALDVVTQYAVHSLNDEFKMQDKTKQMAIIELAEKLNMKDTLAEVIVSLYLHEQMKILDQFKELEVLIAQEEKVKMKDVSDIEALIRIADKFSLQDVSKIFAKIRQFEYAKMTDRKPRTAVSDILIGYIDGLDEAHRWIQPLEMKIDEKGTNLQVMPTAESSYIEVPYADGAIAENTVYKNRAFDILAWSKDGLTQEEKETLKEKIAEVLDSTKKETKRITIQETGIAFDAKYTGTADIKEGPSYIKALLPFEVSPYGYPLFKQEVFGTGLLVNRGDEDVGFKNVIAPGCVNPSFQIGNIVYSWKGTVPINQSLVIDHEKLSCYLETTDGTRTNVLSKLEGEFQKIKKKTSVQIVAFGDTNKYLQTIIEEKVLWKRQ